ncbi:MAG TPA: Mrp/NBP35 family ATP-binding protein [Dehalococcoidales bacterium]|nr:Mrp/NBP35 family ATP-binding protein [Dehalococcoidales bacterium]
MVTEEQVRESLEGVLVPAIKRSIIRLNLVREVAITDGKVRIVLASTGLITGAQDWVKDQVVEVVKKLPEAGEVEVEFVEATPAELNEIGHVIAIMSGKGGVGKSLMASLTAISLRRLGYEVGILDADITGPSIPRMFGINTRPGGNESGMLPVLSKSEIEVMSINLLLPSEDDAVIWRGPLIGKAITQFWEEVLWGKLDYLIIDLPPGTADAPLTVMQTLPISGVVIVFTPQDLTAMVVRKAVNMAQKMEKPILGVVENMAYLYVPEIDKKIELFGSSQGEEMARVSNAPFLGQLPIDPELAKLCDEGNVERYSAELVDNLGKSLSEATSGDKA